jgi:hypothetical protein
MDEHEHKLLLAKYKNHRDQHGGIFTPTTRRRLMGVKEANAKELKPDTADFWYDVKNTVRNGLSDMQLVSEITDNERQEELFGVVKPKDTDENLARASLADVLRTILIKPWKLPAIELDSNGFPRPKREKDEDDYWKAALAREVIKIGLEFYQKNRLITSKAHQRVVEELDDLIDLELYTAFRLPKSERGVKM